LTISKFAKCCNVSVGEVRPQFSQLFKDLCSRLPLEKALSAELVPLLRCHHGLAQVSRQSSSKFPN
jgi:hypothetical protein